MTPVARLFASLSERYRVEREIGRGGSATVYLARDLKHGRPVALKVLNPVLTSSIGAERFLLEIQTTAQLNHPHILPLHDSGEVDGMLYCVLPYVEGETLRDRLTRQPMLPIDEAVEIARQVADALDYAHRRGIIHRDVKPENILFTSPRHVCLSDFGLARAVFSVASDRLTATGLAIGSPLYMSPEQAAGETDVDARSDIYSLGCVLYEMLAGRPPFDGPTAQAVLAKHLTAEATPLRKLRPEVAESLAEAVLRSIAKQPERRTASAATLATSLRTADAGGPNTAVRVSRRIAHSWRKPWIVIGASVVLFGAVAILAAQQQPWISGAEPVLDANTLAFVPYGPASPTAEESAIHDEMLEDLRYWEGLDVKDGRSATGDEPADLAEASTIARGLGAAQLIALRTTQRGAGGQLVVELHRTDDPATPVRRHTIPLSDASSPSAMRAVADSLLFGRVSILDGPVRHEETHSYDARLAFSRAHVALRSAGGLVAADSLLRLAISYDDDYARANLWLAQVRFWLERDAAGWVLLAQQALARRDLLTDREASLAAAIVEMGQKGSASDCSGFAKLVHDWPADFTAWYGRALCLLRDERVVPDPASPTGWAFRASYEQGLRDYTRAFTLFPTIFAWQAERGYAEMRDLLYTGSDQVRTGFSPDGDLYLAFPGWAGDSLQFVAQPASDIVSRKAEAVPRSHARAVIEQQARFNALTSAWVGESPADPLALEARSIALEMAGRPEALDYIVRARANQPDTVLALNLDAARVWLLYKTGASADGKQLTAGRSLADSLLEATKHWARPARSVLASVAALRSKTTLAAELAAAVPASTWDADTWPQTLRASADWLLTYSASKGDPAVLADHADRVETAIRAILPADDTARARRLMLSQAAMLAYANYSPSPLSRYLDRDPLMEAEKAATRNDYAQTATLLRQIRAGERNARVADITLDAILAQATLYLAIGDTATARTLIDRRLEALAASPPQLLRSPIQAASLCNLIRLRAALDGRRDRV